MGPSGHDRYTELTRLLTGAFEEFSLETLTQDEMAEAFSPSVMLSRVFMLPVITLCWLLCLWVKFLPRRLLAFSSHAAHFWFLPSPEPTQFPAQPPLFTSGGPGGSCRFSCVVLNVSRCSLCTTSACKTLFPKASVPHSSEWLCDTCLRGLRREGACNFPFLISCTSLPPPPKSEKARAFSSWKLSSQVDNRTFHPLYHFLY